MYRLGICCVFFSSRLSCLSLVLFLSLSLLRFLIFLIRLCFLTYHTVARAFVCTYLTHTILSLFLIRILIDFILRFVYFFNFNSNARTGFDIYFFSSVLIWLAIESPSFPTYFIENRFQSCFHLLLVRSIIRWKQRILERDIHRFGCVHISYQDGITQI